MHGIDDVAELGTTVSDFRERFELRYRNRHVVPEGSYPLERLIAGEAFDEVVVEVAPAGVEKPQWTHRIRSLVLNDDRGVPDCLVLILNDETERYNAEQRFESAFAANPAPAVILRLQDLCHIRVNRGFIDMTGYAEDDVVGHSLYEIDVLADAARREFAFGRLKEGRTIPQMEATLQLPGGGEKSVIVAGQPIEVGDAPCMLFTFADLDGRRQAEAALRKSEECFEIAFRLSPIPTVVAQRDDGRVLFVNDAFVHETGYLRDDIVGRTSADLPLWTEAQAGATLERLLRKNRRVCGLASSLQRKDGHALECLVFAEAVEIENKACVLLVAQNIAERTRTHVEVAGAIEAVMSDTAWFTSVVLERLTRMKRNGDSIDDAGSLADLTPRLRDVLDLVCQGADDAMIAATLNVSRNTIRNHLTNLYRRTGTKSRAKLIVWARERGVTGERSR